MIMRKAFATLMLLIHLPGLSHADELAANLVVAVQGKVVVRRQAWTGTSPVVVGMVLRLGDILAPDGGGKASILCADLTLVTTGDVPAGIPCRPGGQSELRWNGARVAPARAASTDFPRLLYPRATDLMDGRPKMAWTAAAGVSSYQVSIEGPNFTWTSPALNGTEYVYPTTAPIVKAETDYQVVVRGGGRSSREEGAPGSGFRLLGAPRRTAVGDFERRIKTVPLTDLAHRFALSYLYASQRLLLMAIGALGNPNDAAGFVFLGDLQLRLQRPDLAIEAFRGAVSIVSEDDLENDAYARKMLARLLLGSDDAQARKLLTEASQRYEVLGDRDSLAEITRLLK